VNNKIGVTVGAEKIMPATELVENLRLKINGETLV